MKSLFTITLLAILMYGCQQAPPVDNSAEEAFMKNSETVKAYLEGWQNENVDYSVFADNFIARGTGFGGKDTITLEMMKKADQRMWASYDFELLDTLNLLPGVNPETKKIDGSVRYYGDWKITKVATDSTPERSGILKAYESLDFDENGKIIFDQFYGDFGGLMKHLNSTDSTSMN